MMDIQNGNDLMDGTILSIRVQNFFCHDNFIVEFKKRVTFIIGRNGSGKSAILTALVVGLGGKASETNRGKKFQSFIKEGANSATIEIKIKNSGPQSYKSDVYGNQITIVKTFSISGTSSYKIKLISGQLVPTTAKVVNAIVIAHNIQVNNPISVLNQDDARDFTLKMDPKKLYALFRRATNLDITEENYEKALMYCNNAVVLSDKKKRFCHELKNEYNKWQKLYDHMQSLSSIKNELKMLKAELHWSEVAAAERDAENVRGKCDSKRAKCEEIARAVAALAQPEDRATDELKRQLQESKSEKETLQQQLREQISRTSSARRARDDSGVAVARLVDLLKRERKKVLDYEQEIRNIESGELAVQRAELQQRAQQCLEAEEAARARYSTLQNDLQQARGHMADVGESAKEARDVLSSGTSRLNQLTRELHTLQSSGADTLAVYGASMVQLCQRVRQEAERGVFQTAPRGPVGHYLKVKDAKWGGVLEHIIGGHMRTFCVNSSEDSRKLFRIMENISWNNEAKPTVTCSKFLSAQHDVRRSSVRAPGYGSALQCLHVADPVVANFLIDNCSLEKVLLVPDHENAMRLSKPRDSATPAAPLDNCQKIVTLDCSEYYPAPHYRCYGGRPAHRRLLQTSTAERTQQLQVEIRNVENSLQSHEAKSTTLKAELERAQSRAAEAAMRLRALAAELQRREADARTADAELQRLQAPQLAVLVEELNVSKQSAEALNEKLKSLTDKEEDCRRELDASDVETRELQANLQRLTEVCRKLGEEIDQKELRLQKKVSELRNMENILKEEREKLAKGLDILANKDDAVARIINAAPGPRIETPRDKTVITNVITQSRMKMNSMVPTNMSREVVEQELTVAEQNYRRTRAMLDELRALIDRVKQMAADHLQYCFKLKNEIGRDVGVHFMATLTLRGYFGQILIDHKEETLELVVSGREGSRSASSTASLSGGERSYANVAFITALWECVGLPFYFMDEFDVFMDNVNQQIVVNLLLDIARQRSGHQFVFLTPHGAKINPQDLSTLVDVISMGDPA